MITRNCSEYLCCYLNHRIKKKNSAENNFSNRAENNFSNRAEELFSNRAENNFSNRAENNFSNRAENNFSNRPEEYNFSNRAEELFSNQDKIKWKFKNGTVVVASSIPNAKNVMIHILKKYSNNYNFYAYNLVDNEWNIQFTNEVFPCLYVNVESLTCEKAVLKATESIKKDINELEVLEIII